MAAIYDFGTRAIISDVRRLLRLEVVVVCLPRRSQSATTLTPKQLSFQFHVVDCPAHRLPIHGPLFEGRSGFQILKSAITYLDFCSGREWRPASHRFHPTVEYFVAGIRVLKPIAASFAQSRAHSLPDVVSARSLKNHELPVPQCPMAERPAKKPSQSIGSLPQQQRRQV